MSEDYYYLHDHLKSPVAVVDLDGEVIERYEYDAYVKPTYWEGDYSGTIEATGIGNPYYFTGRRIDFVGVSAFMIQYHRGRFLDYYTGCWLNEDPIGYQDGVNLYTYVNSNPINWSDPHGLISQDDPGYGYDDDSWMDNSMSFPTGEIDDPSGLSDYNSQMEGDFLGQNDRPEMSDIIDYIGIIYQYATAIRQLADDIESKAETADLLYQLAKAIESGDMEHANEIAKKLLDLKGRVNQTINSFLDYLTRRVGVVGVVRYVGDHASIIGEYVANQISVIHDAEVCISCQMTAAEKDIKTGRYKTYDYVGTRRWYWCHRDNRTGKIYAYVPISKIRGGDVVEHLFSFFGEPQWTWVYCSTVCEYYY